MKKNSPKHIVCFALPAWEAAYLRSTVELMKGAADENLVLYVDYAYTISDCIKGIFGKKNFDWKRLLGIKKRLRRISGTAENGLYVLSLPPVFPSFKINSYKLFKLANRLNAIITGFFINRAITKLKMSDIIGFNAFQPFLGRYWKIKNQKFSVYYVYDDFTNVPWFHGFAVKEEESFIDDVDLIVVSSEELKRRKTQQFNKPTEVVNNGVHFDSFFNARKKNGPAKNGMTTIGYTGTIDNRLDIGLLEYVVAEMPATRFLFVGKVFEREIYNRLIKYGNVIFEAPVPADDIPGIQREMNVGIIPYICNELTAAVYPLKVNEYLAMGLPVVVTPFASLGEADDVIYTVKRAEEFKGCLEKALRENDIAVTQKRFSIAKKADWKERSNQLMKIIERNIVLKHGHTPATN